MASTTSFDRIAEIRARPRQLPPPPAPARPRMPVAEAALRQMVWGLAHEAGLSAALLEWVQDAAESRGETPPAHVEYSAERAAMAATLLLEARISDHPLLRQGPWDLDSPVWSPGFACPPGLALQPASDSLRSQIITACGIGRLMAPTVHPPMRNSPRALRRWLIPVEVYRYFEEQNHF
ncbi:hypothetical protein [Specibacter sp. RAF43]|uniref:hypothetical protein n=1 Tax=Specibacter sp. RAF43 TaxID=3233057 RepID=UPI003F95E753